MAEAPTIAYTCSYVPIEIILAAGLKPERILPEGRPDNAESHLPPNTCCYVKSLFSSACDRKMADFNGIVFANSCDGMRRLYDLWGRYVKHLPALFCDIPKKKDLESIAFFASELKRLASGVETVLHGRIVTATRLNAAIRECNQVRRAMNAVFSRSDQRGSGLFVLCRNGSQAMPGVFLDSIRAYGTQSGSDQQDASSAKRIVITGNILNRPDLITLVENAGARVVDLDICFGARHYDTLVDEDTPDPFAALARRYLTRTSCPRMMGFDEHFAHLKTIYKEQTAHGIICSNVKYCDPLLYTMPLLQQRFRNLNIPFLGLENDYAWDDLAQIQTRVETFIAMLPEVHHV